MIQRKASYPRKHQIFLYCQLYFLIANILCTQTFKFNFPLYMIKYFCGVVIVKGLVQGHILDVSNSCVIGEGGWLPHLVVQKLLNLLLEMQERPHLELFLIFSSLDLNIEWQIQICAFYLTSLAAQESRGQPLYFCVCVCGGVIMEKLYLQYLNTQCFSAQNLLHFHIL